MTKAAVSSTAATPPESHLEAHRELAPPAENGFPIVGIGASAGGLEALDQFLRAVPKDSGLAFVIVQHLDPTHQGIMPELLQRSTGMVVEQVRDQVKVGPNRVYVIAPNKDLSLLRGTLHRLPQSTTRAPWTRS
jgi:chemotaxis response regulator CheB